MRRLLILLMAPLLSSWTGCAGSGDRASPPVLKSPPEYGEVVEAYNRRAIRLGRIWARAVVSIEYIDENGRSRYQQGDGHLQIIQPSRLALSIGKLGEVFLWIGSDDERYWLLEPREHRRGFVGSHELTTRAKIDALGIPVAPLELIRLLGITPLPVEQPGESSVAWNSGGDLLVLDDHAGGRVWRHFIDPDSFRPSRIELLTEGGTNPVLSSRLTSYEQVRIRGEGGFFPRVASRIRLTHHEQDAVMRLSIEGMVDGGRNRLSPQVFELASLVDLLGIEEIRDLDSSPQDQLSAGGSR